MNPSAGLSVSDNVSGSVSDFDSSTASASTFASFRWKELDVQSLVSILASREGLKCIVELQGEDAVAVVENIDRALEFADLDPAQRKNCIVALRKLCERCGIIPTSHILTDGLETIGRWPRAGGKFAEVWEGQYKERLVAIKALRVYGQDDLVQVKKRFHKEAVVWKYLSHPNILPFLGVSTSPPFQLSLVSVWMTHGDIASYTRAHPEANRLLLLSDVACGLNYLHTENLVHGDLKAANILINNDHRACLADFGLTVVFHHSLTAYSTSTAASGGTLRWMAPELILPERYGFTHCRPSKESDVYALGMVIYEVITGNVPFYRYGTMAVMQKVLDGKRPERPIDSTVARMSDDLWEMVELCWHQERIKRPMTHIVLTHLNEATQGWVPPSPTTLNFSLDIDDNLDTSSTILDPPYTTKRHETVIQMPVEDNTPSIIKSSSHNGPPNVTADGLRAILQGASDSKSSAPPDILQPPVADLSQSTTPVPPMDPGRSKSKQRSSSRLSRTLEGSQEGIKEVRSREGQTGVTASSNQGLLRPGDDEHTSFLTECGHALVGCFRRTQKLEDLGEAITYYRRALELTPPGDTKRSGLLDSIAVALHDRFNRIKEPGDLEEAIAYYRQALDLRPVGHSDRSPLLNYLANALHDRFNQTHGLDDLEEAIVYHRQALDLRPVGHLDRSTSLNNLALSLHDRFDKIQEPGDLEEAITYYRQALDLRPVGHSDRSSSLNYLANALHDRFNKTHGLDDLEEAIVYHRQALDLRPAGHLDRSTSLNNLALSLHDRFNRIQEPGDLEEAIAYYRQALDLRPVGHSDQSSLLNYLANAIHDRFNQTYGLDDLEEAIAYYRQALDLRPVGHSDRSSSLNSLADALQVRFEQTRSSKDLSEVARLRIEAATLR